MCSVWPKRRFRPEGGRVGVVSVSGGAGVVAADYLEGSKNLSLADLGEDTVEKVAAPPPSFATARNPIDVTAQIFNEPDLFERVVAVLQENQAVDQILACVASVHSAVGVRVAEAIVVAAETLKLPIVVSWAARDSLNAEAFKLLEAANIPVFRSPERALKAMDSMTSFTDAQAGLVSLLDPASPAGSASAEKLTWARSVEFDVLSALAGYGVTIPAQRMASTPEEAVAAAEAVGYPVAVKIQSPDIPHKVAAGGVRLRLKDAAEVAAGTAEIFNACRSASVESRGVVIQNMAAPGTELILGYIRDAALGGFILCGQGGSDVEAVNDRVLIPTPATSEEILAGLGSLRVLQETKASDAGWKRSWA